MSGGRKAGREPGTLPFPDRPAGTVNEEMPFDHLVVVMMENHSFDNLLGALSLTRPDVCGLTFENGKATNSNPGGPNTPSTVTAFPLPDTAQGSNVSQNWKDSHDQMNGRAMDGFVRSQNSVQPMGYYTPEVLPFAYSLASSFTVANRWFCSVPGPTYPNRRFLLAGTADGTTETHGDPLTAESPPGGTVFDLLSRHHINWSDYFSDVPMSVVVGRGILRHIDHHHPIDEFYTACRAGTLPAVSFIDPRIGVLSRIGRPIAKLGPPFDWFKAIGADLRRDDPAETEEDPQDMYYGEAWAHRVVDAVLKSPCWPRTCLIYLYDEHGGYYDHVAPPAAIPPDDIPPVLQPGDPIVGYDRYGPRVPAIVVSPYSKPGGSTSEDHDHTSVLATIEAKWNLPALTRRDANAASIEDFFASGPPGLLTPPVLTGPSPIGPSGPAVTGR